MTSTELYQAIMAIREVHRDVASLFESVDAELDERGWERTEKNRVSSDLTNGLSPDWWVIQYVSRFYVPRGVTATDKAIVFSVVFLPEAHDYSIAFCAGARLAPVVPREDLWQGWKDARPLLRFLKRRPEGGPVDPKVLRDGFLPGAASGVAAVSPLLELETMDVVRERLLMAPLTALRA